MQFPTVLSAKALAEFQQQNPRVRLLDVRSSNEWGLAHIAGSYNVPLATLAEHTAEIAQHVQDPVVLICQSDARAQQAQELLQASRLPHVHVLQGGLDAWEAAKLPIVRRRERWVLERQIRGVAGSLVLFSLLASFLWPAFKFIALFVGAGLTWSAISNTCAMGTLLSKLPYNRNTQTSDLSTILKAFKQSPR